MTESEKPFEVVASALRERIAMGEWGPGSRLASVRALAEEYGVAPGTVQRALTALRKDGLIETSVGQGSRIAKSAKTQGKTEAQRLAAVEASVRQLTKRIKELEGKVEG